MSGVIIPASQRRAPNVRILTYRDIDGLSSDERQLNYLKNIFRQYKGKTIEIGKKHLKKDINTDEITDQIITNSQITTVPNRGFNSWWRQFTGTGQFLFPDSEEWIFSDSYNPPGSMSNQAQLTIMPADRVGGSSYEQFFLLPCQGITHCVFTPMMNWAIDLSINAGSESTRRKYESKAKKINKLMNEFNKGVPEKDIPRICNDLQIGIEIDMPSSILDKNTNFIKYRSQKKPIKIFKFINTRLNHIDLNEITNKDNYEEVSQDELKNIYDNTHDFKLWKGDREDQLYQINTLKNVYKLTQDEGYSKVVKDFSDLNNLSQFKIEHNSQKNLSKYLLDNVNRLNALVLNCKYKEGTEKYNIFKQYLDDEQLMIDDEKQYRKNNSSEEYKNTFEKGYDHNCKCLEIIDYIHSLKNLNHIDLKSAYTKGNECNFYKGYLGKISDFRRCNKIQALGIYTIYNIKNIPPLLKRLKVLHENNAYTSPELEFYKSLGITFDIWGGCWGSRTDIIFTDEMFEKENNLKHYCKWYGCLMKLTKKDRYNFDCKDIEFAKLNNITEKCDIRYNQYRGTGIIEYKKDKCYHSAHIASFIHSYARITMIEQLLNFKDIDQIIAVQVDGIFYNGDVEINKLFVKKPGKSIKYIQGSEYVIDCENDKPKLPKNRIHNPVELHTGAGGAGKTHNNLIDKGLIAPLYVAPSWKLARKKSEEYKIDSSVFHYLITKDPQVWMPNLRNYNTLIIDEISMMNNNEKNLILKRFKHHKIIFCGDLGYQLPPIEGYEFNPDKLPLFKHTKNYRCQCEVLAKILMNCRKLIEKDLIDIDTKEIVKNFGFEIHKKENINYSVEDLIITKTHKNKDYYTEKYKDIEKYIVKENTRDYSNGEIVIGSKPEGVLSELQHAFTIHSIQGETCKDTLFIDINKMNCLRMLYTALSRAKLFSQIKIIE
tara:strand:+ start:578 stop:3391 length:2814 start_codon:yes stop_codon:yes gene_type:complete